MSKPKSSTGHGDHMDIEHIIAEINKKENLESLAKEEHEITDKYTEAIGLEEVKKILKLTPPEPGKETEQAMDIYTGLAHFYAKIKGYDVSENSKGYALGTARQEVRDILNKIFEEQGMQRGYGQYSGLRYALDLIREGQTYKILEALRDQVATPRRTGLQLRLMEAITGKDLQTDLKAKRALAEAYAEKFGGDASDYQEIIHAHVFHKAQQMRYNPVKDVHGGHGHKGSHN